MQQVSRENPCFRNDLSRGREAAASPVQESAGCSPGLDEHELLRYLSQSAVISQRPHPAQRVAPVCRLLRPADNDTSFEQRVLLSGIDATTTADGVRQTVNLTSSYLFENYSEIGRVSWEASGDKPATERVAFSWGPTTSWLGWTWLLASEVGTGVVTLLSTTLDDGLRNGIENSLTLTRQQQ